MRRRDAASTAGGTPALLLTLGTIVAAAACDHDALDRSLAHQAGLSFPAIDPVLQLKESFFTVGVNIIGNR